MGARAGASPTSTRGAGARIALLAAAVLVAVATWLILDHRPVAAGGARPRPDGRGRGGGRRAGDGLGARPRDPGRRGGARVSEENSHAAQDGVDPGVSAREWLAYRGYAGAEWLGTRLSERLGRRIF